MVAENFSPTKFFQAWIVAVFVPLIWVGLGSVTNSAETVDRVSASAALFGVERSPQLLAQRERRTALVIGNGNYGAEGSLKNPPNDATDIAQALRGLGFGVKLLQNSNKRQIAEAIEQFNRELYQGGVGLFYYAGHGVQVEGENYLIPIGAKIDRESDVAYEAIPLGKILGAMEAAGNPVNIVLLDACRNNPYSRGWRSAVRGLATIQSAEGTLISFATAPGRVAADGDGRNSPYTASLLQNIQTPNLPIPLLFQQVRQSVKENTGGKQIPWEASSLTGNFAFKSAGSIPPSTAPKSLVPPVAAKAPLPSSSPTVFDPSQVAQSGSPRSSEAQLTRSNEGIFFELKGCRKESSTVKCEFLITDQTESRQLAIYARRKSKIIDTQGNEYLVERIRFGSSAANGTVTQSLPQSIGLKAFITFENVPNQVNQLALVEISAYTKRQGPFIIQFRDIPVSN
jgi:hypothetical protein